MLIRAATFLVVAAFFYLCYRLFRRYRFHFRHQCERAAAFLSGKKSRKSWLWFKTNIRCYQKGAPFITRRHGNICRWRIGSNL